MRGNMLMMLTFSMSVGSLFAWDSWEFMSQIKPVSNQNAYINIRKFVIDLQGKNKRILDIGCGNGDSTSNGKGCLGIDNNRDAIDAAIKKHPDKSFKLGVITSWKPEENYDITTSMFYLHKLNASKRKQIISVAKRCADERVVILDVSPDFQPSERMIEENPYLIDFLVNSRKEMADFTEHTMIQDNISMWTFDKNDKGYKKADIIDSKTLKKILYLYRPI
jgi:SAM-dependent methyltransferase